MGGNKRGSLWASSKRRSNIWAFKKWGSALVQQDRLLASSLLHKLRTNNNNSERNLHVLNVGPKVCTHLFLSLSLSVSLSVCLSVWSVYLCLCVFFCLCFCSRRFCSFWCLSLYCICSVCYSCYVVCLEVSGYLPNSALCKGTGKINLSIYLSTYLHRVCSGVETCPCLELIWCSCLWPFFVAFVAFVLSSFCRENENF